jgi:nucleoside-diphosphate-sugar epimerase
VSRDRVLITGAAGLVGSRLVSRYLREGLAVRALDRQPVDVAGVEGIVGDVTDVDTVLHLERRGLCLRRPRHRRRVHTIPQGRPSIPQ